jgi:uncharacterized protein YndB with AHSA1/START domain
MDKLRVEAEGAAAAPQAVVWSLLSNASKYAEWGPWNGSGDRKLGNNKASGDIGTTRWLRYRNTTTVEGILEVEPGERVVYTVISGIPVRNYRAEVTLTPTAGGTHIYWEAEWDSTLLGRVVRRKLRTLYPQIVASLIASAERAAVTAGDDASVDIGSYESVGASA